MTGSPYILKDNSTCPDELAEGDYARLKDFVGKSLKDLCAENPRLLVFPDCLNDNEDDIGKSSLFSLNGNRIAAGNTVGFWGVNGVNVRIHSRFDEDYRQFLFHYMLQRVSGVNVLDLSTLPDADNLWDFLIYLFPMMLKRAMAQGVFRTYRSFSYDDDRIRGAIAVAPFIRRDVPFRGRVSYITREHTGNNHVLHLVRHTIERIRQRAPLLLLVDQEMRQAVASVVSLTPDYSRNALARVLAANLRPVRHPFYTEYAALQSLCLRILRHEKMSFGVKDGKISGVVFDISWVWEEYLAAVFNSNKATRSIQHPRNRGKSGAVRLFKYKDSPLYPDFYDRSRKLVLDAKYKRLETYGVNREDKFQLVTYLHVMKMAHGILLHPSESGQFEFVEEGELAGLGGEIGRLPFAIPRNVHSTYGEFAQKMLDAEKTFVHQIVGIRMDKPSEGR